MNAFFRFLRNLRLVWWFVAAILALLATDRAHAQNGSSNGPYSTISAAYAGCEAEKATHWGQGTGGMVAERCFNAAGTIYAGTFPNTILGCIDRTTGNCSYYEKYPYTTGCVSPATWNETTHSCVAPGPSAEDVACAAEVPWWTNVQHPNGSVHCDPLTDCAMTAINIGDGGQVKLIPFEVDEGVGEACESGSYTCPAGYIPAPEGYPTLVQLCFPEEGDIDSDGIPNDEDPTPTEHGSEARDSDGDGVSDAQDAFPNDPDNGKDKEDGETANTSTGGGNCESPPVSHGDAIAGNIAYQTWATRCAVDRLAKITKDGTAKVTVVGGVIGGGSGEVDGGVSGGENCVHTYNITGGDPINAQALVEAQRLRCQQKAQREADEAGAGDVGDSSSDGSGAWQEASAVLPDESGYGWDEGNPLTSMSIGGSTYALPFAEERGVLLNSIKALVIFLAGVICFFILQDV